MTTDSLEPLHQKARKCRERGRHNPIPIYEDWSSVTGQKMRQRRNVGMLPCPRCGLILSGNPPKGLK